ncbi:ABC transporter permease [Amycolatopsis thermoflava]|uniref:ABC transporter permease n=1 Tax=Amycolatopsis thermoflava TaxID=84480 RepID=UPI00365953E4
MPGVLSRALRRAGQAVFVVWAAFTGAFVALYLLPSDPVTLMLAQKAGGDTAVIDPAQAAQLRSAYGFDRPLWEQYLTLLGRAVTGDFGASVQTGEPVRGLVLGTLPQTAGLAAFALLLALGAGVALALLAGLTRNGFLRQVLESVPAAGVSIPSFWLGLLLLQLLAFHWSLFPATGGDGFASLVLPAITLAVPTAAIVAQVLGRSLRETLAQPYVQLAQAKGASRVWILFRHALRNASLPAVTITGILVGNLLGGAVVVETVFGRHALGAVTVDAVSNQDLPVVLGLVVLAAVVYVVVSLVVEAIYPLLDPRVRPVVRSR